MGILALCIAVSASALGQQTSDSQTRNRAARYFLGSDDELLIPVNVWGFVQRPGQYMVPNNTDLISLISFAGGPSEGAKMRKIKIVRNDPRTGNRIYSVNIKKFLNTADSKLIPALKPGDTVIVKGTTLSWIQKFFAFLSNFAIFTQMVYFIAIATEYLRQ